MGTKLPIAPAKPSRLKTVEAGMATAQAPQCEALLGIARDFWADVQDNCPRCNDEGGTCLADVVLTAAAERRLPS